MTPAARFQAAIEILDAWSPGQGMDRLLLRWSRGARYAGSGDRAAVADLVYEALRRWRSLGWPEDADATSPGRRRLLALAAERGEPEPLFGGGRHAPAPITAQERTWLAARAAETPPEAVACDMPDWLAPVFRTAWGDRAPAVMSALRGRAPLDLRVNRLKTTPQAALEALAGDGVSAAPGPLSPDCLRVGEGARRLRRAAAYLDGRVEIQDAASQAAAAFAEARPGERVLDFCAGGGGKALALAAAMQGEGEIHAHDADPARMSDLPDRALRAGAGLTVLPGPVPRGEAGRFDLVFADAPCSGSGAWRRNPDAKWAFAPEALDRLRALQARVMDEAAHFVAPGGRLVYATCSLLAEENERQVEAFLRRNPGWTSGARLALSPLDGGDGFFANKFSR